MMKNGQPSKWMKLDNAAKIYPASRSTSWMAIFRLSAELKDEVDPALLALAEKRAASRFPSLCTRLRRGFFWYYLEHIDGTPAPEEDVANPCAKFNFKKTGRYMFRVRYYRNRIAVEYFHVLTDGTGGLRFLKTLLAEYIELRYGEKVPRNGEIPDCGELPKPEEVEDSFLKYARGKGITRPAAGTYTTSGHSLEKGDVNVITAIINAESLTAAAHRYGATVTEYLTAALICAFRDVEKTEKKKKKRSLPIAVCVPVNLRKFYGSVTMRNFSEFVNVGMDYRLGDFSFEETVEAVHHQMKLYATEKYLNAVFSADVGAERNPVIRGVPLFMKNTVMKLIYKYKGDRTSTTTLSNLGLVTLPEEMSKYVTRMDFVLGALSENPSAFASVCYNGTTTVTMLRSITESDAERNFARRLVKDGVKVKVESNTRYQKEDE